MSINVTRPGVSQNTTTVNDERASHLSAGKEAGGELEETRQETRQEARQEAATCGRQVKRARNCCIFALLSEFDSSPR